MKARTWLFLLAMGASLTAPARVSADTRIAFGVNLGPAYADYRGGASSYGFERGLRDGSNEGWNDVRHRHPFELWRESAYRCADAGYKGWMGPRWEYSEAYRRGFEQGYRRAFDSVRYGSGYSYDRRWDDRDRYDR